MLMDTNAANNKATDPFLNRRPIKAIIGIESANASCIQLFMVFVAKNDFSSSVNEKSISDGVYANALGSCFIMIKIPIPKIRGAIARLGTSV
ncbi:hypothetical protein GCM10011344_00110 [Dokdonia pacifica]|nr:hypothetical protein GCM10011344_00110 [Dokdonia pacifica]